MPPDTLILTPEDADATTPTWQARCLTLGCELQDAPAAGDEVTVSITATAHARRRGHRVEIARWVEDTMEEER